jgi:hypothetical protein
MEIILLLERVQYSCTIEAERMYDFMTAVVH